MSHPWVCTNSQLPKLQELLVGVSQRPVWVVLLIPVPPVHHLAEIDMVFMVELVNQGQGIGVIKEGCHEGSLNFVVVNILHNSTDQMKIAGGEHSRHVRFCETVVLSGTERFASLSHDGQSCMVTCSTGLHLILMWASPTPKLQLLQMLPTMGAIRAL